MSSLQVHTAYESMVDAFKTSRDKNELLKFLIDYCGNPSTTNQNVYDLKKKLEVDFAKDVGCNYSQIATSNNYGCDVASRLYSAYCVYNVYAIRSDHCGYIYKECIYNDIYYVL